MNYNEINPYRYQLKYAQVKNHFTRQNQFNVSRFNSDMKVNYYAQDTEPESNFDMLIRNYKQCINFDT